MSKIHILKGNNKEYRAVLHFATPSGSNSAGKSWKDCALEGGIGATILPEGDGVGQITAVEKASIVAGDVIEISDSILVESGDASVASLNEMANKLIDSTKESMQIKYKYYGYTQE